MASDAFARLASLEELDESECEVFQVKVRENGDVIWRGFPVDRSDPIGGILNIR